MTREAKDEVQPSPMAGGQPGLGDATVVVRAEARHRHALERAGISGQPHRMMRLDKWRAH